MTNASATNAVLSGGHPSRRLAFFSHLTVCRNTSGQLLAGNILRDPANRQVRQTLPRLDLYERTTQLCNIEALEQLRLAKPGSAPDALVPTAFEETSILNGVMKAPKGAYRLDRQWFEVSFECSVGTDLESVTAFRFKTGLAIPKEEWEEHNLIAEDFDDD